MFRASPLLCDIQYYELELIHNIGYDNLQDYQCDHKETYKVHSNQPTGSDLRGKSLLNSV